jgi:hypothetical protein
MLVHNVHAKRSAGINLIHFWLQQACGTGLSCCLVATVSASPDKLLLNKLSCSRARSCDQVPGRGPLRRLLYM